MQGFRRVKHTPNQEVAIWPQSVRTQQVYVYVWTDSGVELLLNNWNMRLIKMQDVASHPRLID